MIVGVTTRLVPVSYGKTQEQRDALAHDWCALLERFGVVPVLIPNALTDPAAYAAQLGVERLLLSGGDSLGRLVLEVESNELDSNKAPICEIASAAPTRRDRTEAALLEWALEKAVPVLGVCRGMQLLNTYFGGGLTRSLVQHVPQESHVASHHAIRFLRGPFAGRNSVVNSYHDEGVLVAQLAPSLEILAQTESGVIEALRHPQKPIVAMQWHPERPSPSPALDEAFLRAWLEGR